ncbi:hypothetical protein AXF42_Ash017973 [Apostasia shenzhenica]|uniref:Uncharacterized protein n=1 Tax=Apostasia shenzhenica TaxID=1088818 RepID=A0A2I0A517_9ASPA|nr:hypothetical protein AXF42_Ash017973 [Apostasia shenzhenica]
MRALCRNSSSRVLPVLSASLNESLPAPPSFAGVLRGSVVYKKKEAFCKSSPLFSPLLKVYFLLLLVYNLKRLLIFVVRNVHGEYKYLFTKCIASYIEIPIKEMLWLRCDRAHCLQLGLSVSHFPQNMSRICATALRAKNAVEQTQTVTQQPSTITVAPTLGKEKLPKLDDGGCGLPPRNGGGGGGGGGNNWSGGFYFFSFLIFLNYLKELEDEDAHRDKYNRASY